MYTQQLHIKHKKIRIIPGVLDKKLEPYITQVKTVSKFTKSIHIDVMDGEYVLTKSPDLYTLVESLKDEKVVLDFHLMTYEMEEKLKLLSNYKNIRFVYCHIENLDPKLLGCDKEYHFKVVPVINPDINIDNFSSVLNSINDIMFMTVQPGGQGNPFTPEALDAITYIKEKYNFKGKIHIDGGVNDNTINHILKYNPDLLVVGSFIAQSKNPKEAYEFLEGKIDGFTKEGQPDFTKRFRQV